MNDEYVQCNVRNNSNEQIVCERQLLQKHV